MVPAQHDKFLPNLFLFLFVFLWFVMDRLLIKDNEFHAFPARECG